VSRSPLERIWAWLYTGPLGHLYGVVADVSVLWARYGALAARRRLRGRRAWRRLLRRRCGGRRGLLARRRGL